MTVNQNILVGAGYGGDCPYCIAVDNMHNKIGNSDTVKKTIQVGRNPTYVLVSFLSSQTYVASDDTLSVINSTTDTVKENITLPFYYNESDIRHINAMYINTSHSPSLIVISGNTQNAASIKFPIFQNGTAEYFNEVTFLLSYWIKHNYDSVPSLTGAGISDN